MNEALAPLRRTYRFLYRWYGKIRRAALLTWAVPLFMFDYAVLLLPHVRAIRRAEVIYPLWFWSFGHQAIDLHHLAMRYEGKRLLVLLSDYGNFNPHIVDSFRPFVNIRDVRHGTMTRRMRAAIGVPLLKRLKRSVLRLYLLGKRTEIPWDYHARSESRIAGTFINEYMELMRLSRSIVVAPLRDRIDAARRRLEAAKPELRGKWFVALYLRRKSTARKDARDTNPGPYRAVIDRVHAEGGFVFCGGDYQPGETFPGASGVIGYDDVPFDRATADYFFLLASRFIIGGHSGPVGIAIAFDRPMLITNNAFFYLSGHRPNQRVIYKKLKDRSGRILLPEETFSLPIVAFHTSEQFADAGLTHIDNDESALLAGLEEMLDEHVRGKFSEISPADRALLDRFRSLLPPDAVAARSPARPTLSYLRALGHILPL